MSARHVFLATVLGLPLVTAAWADKLDKESKAWLDGVAPIILPDEEKTYRGLKDKQDRLEFQKIFWGKRDPDLETPVNEYQTAYETARAAADSKYKTAGRPGSLTDCGRVFILLGEPAEVKKLPVGDTPGPRGGGEVWTYKGTLYKGGQIEIPLDGECKLPEGFDQQLTRVAEDRIAHPNINYRLGNDGHLVKLADQLPKPTPSRALLKEPRQDFPVASDIIFLKEASGGTMMLGLIRGEAAGLTVAESGGKKTAKVIVCAEVVGEDGKSAASTEQAFNVEIGPDGAFLGAFRLGLRPGKYTLKAGALEETSQKGSVATVSVEVPDLNKSELTMSTIMLLSGIDEAPPVKDHPLEAFRLNPTAPRLIPAFGGALKRADSISFFYQYYDAQVDAGTGKASAVASLRMLKDGKTLSGAPDQEFETTIGGSMIGPVPLASYPPGKYTVELKIKDKVAAKDYTQTRQFEVQ